MYRILIEFSPISDLDGGCDSDSTAYTQQASHFVGGSRKRTTGGIDRKTRVYKYKQGGEEKMFSNQGEGTDEMAASGRVSRPR